MKKVAVAFLVLVMLLAGCVSGGSVQADYEELQRQYDALERKHETLQTKYAEISEEYEKLLNSDSETEIYHWKTQYVAYSILYGAERTGLGEFYIESSVKTMAGVYDIDEEDLRDCIDIILEIHE